MLKVGKSYITSKSFSQDTVDKFAAITGDCNYLHCRDSDSYDRFEGPIVHGALIMSEFSKILGMHFPGPGTIYQSQNIKFYSPLYIGEMANFNITVTDTPKDGRATVSTHCSSGVRSICGGEAKIIYKYVTKDIIKDKLLDLGIKKGDTVLVHSSFKSLGPVSGGPRAVIDAIVDAVGDRGTVIMPTFNFDFAKGVPYDVANTPSKMGIITETVRKMPESYSVTHPMYSFAVLGYRAEQLSRLNNKSAYGEDSIFAKLVELDGKILVMGLSYNDSMTFFHHVEEMVGCDYRYMKDFRGNVIRENDVVKNLTYSMFVRDIEAGVITMVDPMGKRLERLGLVKKDTIGQCNVKLMNAGEVFEATRLVPHKEPHLLRKIEGR